MAKILKQEVDVDAFGDITFDEYPQLTLQTRSGAYMWGGREKEEGYIMAFEFYLKKLRNIQAAAKDDDPWADKAFFYSHIAISDAEAATKEMLEMVESLKSNIHSRLKIPNATVSQTVTLEIRQHSILGWKALEVLLTADDIVKLALEAHHVGRISQKQKIAFIRQAEGIVRGMMTPVYAYTYFGVTRDDVAANTQVAQKAKAKMGRIESEFLEAKKRSEFAPVLPERRRNVMPEFKDEAKSKAGKEAQGKSAAA